MKKLLILLISVILVIPCFSSIRKEQGKSTKHNPIKLKKMSGMVASLQNNKTLDVETKRSLHSILFHLKSKNVNMKQINSMAMKVRSSLIKTFIQKTQKHKDNISRLSNINTSLKNRINYLNKRLSEINNRKGKDKLTIEVQNYSDSIQFVEELHKPKLATEIKQENTHSLVKSIKDIHIRTRSLRFANTDQLKAHLLTRINLLKKTADKTEINKLALQDAMNNQAQLMQMMSNIIKMTRELNQQ